MKNIIIGYSGHAYVVCDIFESNEEQVTAYFEKDKKDDNPFMLTYLGSEQDESALSLLDNNNWFVAIGSNNLRKKIIEQLIIRGAHHPIMIVHKNAIVSKKSSIGFGTMCAAGVIINAQTKIGKGVICNTGSIIEHECKIGDFVHIAPGSVLAGNVEVGEGSFIGANSVVKEGVKIGRDVMIGAGSVVIRDIPDGIKVAGNPAKKLER